MIDKIWEVLTTLSDESQKAALQKCVELEFDTTRGIVSLDESFINLTVARNTLQGAIQKKKLIQLPISIQKSLLSQLEAISRSLTNLLNGTDEVENLSNYIEQLNLAIWQYGLHNLSDEVLGYLEKMNQLKAQEVQISQLTRELEQALEKESELNNLVKEATDSVEKLKALVTQSSDNSAKTDEHLENTTEVSQNAAALLATIQQNETSSTQLLATSKTSNAEITALEPKVKEFYSQIEQYRNKIDTTSEDAKSTIKKNSEETQTLISQLGELEDQIKNQIQKATGFSLFHSFQTRQEQLARSKRFWIGAIIALVIASIGVSIFVMTTTDTFDVAFYLKLSMSLPLIYFITFCTVPYGRERKLEEEYAFKSNISISLVPYKELVEGLINDKQAGEREKFTAFIIDSVTKVFTSPTDSVFDTDKRSSDPKDILGQIEKAVGAIVKPLDPLLKALKH